MKKTLIEALIEALVEADCECPFYNLAQQNHCDPGWKVDESVYDFLSPKRRQGRRDSGVY